MSAGSCAEPRRDGEERAHAAGLEPVAALELGGQALDLGGPGHGLLGEPGRRLHVRGRVLEVARGVHCRHDHGGAIDHLRDVVVRAHQQRVEAAVLVGLALERVEAIGGEHRALDQARDDGVVDVVGDLPAQPLGAELRRARLRRRGRQAGLLGAEVVALAQAREHEAPAAGVGDRDLLQTRLGLAGVDQRLEGAALDVVGDRLPVEEADGDGVGVRLERAGGRRGDLHRPRNVTPKYHSQPSHPRTESQSRCPRP